MSLLTIIAGVAAIQGAGKAELPTVNNTHFLVSDGAGEPIESSRVPYRPNASCYSWVIAVAPTNGELAVREVFELPGSARSWNTVDPDTIVTEPGNEPVTAVNNDRSIGVTEFRDSLDDGLITHGWCVAEGDPTGPHRIRVFVGDELLYEFHFEVVAGSY